MCGNDSIQGKVTSYEDLQYDLPFYFIFIADDTNMSEEPTDIVLWNYIFLQLGRSMLSEVCINLPSDSRSYD